MARQVEKDIMTFHPGYYIKEIIEEMGITQDEFAKRLKITSKYLSELVNKKANISQEIALNLSLMFGTSVEVWLNLQSQYDSKMLEIEKAKRLEREVEIQKCIDYNYFVSLGLVESCRNHYQRVENLLKLFKTSSLDNLGSNFGFQFRQHKPKNERDHISKYALVETFNQIGMKQQTNDFNEKLLNSSLCRIRELTTMNSSDAVSLATNILSDCGVALVVLPKLKNADVNGVTYWYSKKKALVGVTDRKKCNDVFWFSLIHELGHIKQKKITKTYVESSDQVTCFDENEANKFAENFLIPEDQLLVFIKSSQLNKSSITRFANTIGIHPGIVVGRLQKEKLITHGQFNELKTKFDLSQLFIEKDEKRDHL